LAELVFLAPHRSASALSRISCSDRFKASGSGAQIAACFFCIVFCLGQLGDEERGIVEREQPPAASLYRERII
jgi:hypothetical protein